MEADFVKSQAKSGNVLVDYAVRWCIRNSDRETGRVIYSWLMEHCKLLADAFDFGK